MQLGGAQQLALRAIPFCQHFGILFGAGDRPFGGNLPLIGMGGPNINAMAATASKHHNTETEKAAVDERRRPEGGRSLSGCCCQHLQEPYPPEAHAKAVPA